MTDPQPAHDIEAVFHQKGIPFTRQRRLIWDFFAGADRATTITEAADALRSEGVGQATVYRTVQLLSDLGLLARVQDGRGEVALSRRRSDTVTRSSAASAARWSASMAMVTSRILRRGSPRPQGSRSTATTSRCTASASPVVPRGMATMASDAPRTTPAFRPPTAGTPARRSPLDPARRPMWIRI